MNPPTIAVRVRDNVHARVAWAVASHPGVGKVGMLGQKPPSAWRDLVVGARELPKADIVVDPEPNDEGIVVTAGNSSRPGIIHASPQGLAQALLRRLAEPGAVAVWTTSGKPSRVGGRYSFPAPLGNVHALAGNAPIEGEAAGAGAFGSGSLVVVDDRRFLETVCIAAGAVVADVTLTSPVPVWERSEAYLAACEQLGLVIAQSVSAQR